MSLNWATKRRLSINFFRNRVSRGEGGDLRFDRCEEGEDIFIPSHTIFLEKKKEKGKWYLSPKKEKKLLWTYKSMVWGVGGPIPTTKQREPLFS